MTIYDSSLRDSIVPRKKRSIKLIHISKNASSVHTELIADVDFFLLRSGAQMFRSQSGLNNSWLLNNKVYFFI